MIEITFEQLSKIYTLAKKSNIELYLPYLNMYMDFYGINTYKRIAAFLAQIGHESGQLKYTEELASGSAYEGRKDLGNTQIGDGKKYKGRGLIQITGRKNYEEISNVFRYDFISNPEELSKVPWCVETACEWYFQRKYKGKLLIHWSDENTDNSFKNITRGINGGLNGYEDRFNLWNRAKKILNVS